ncbi:MAG: tyrosine-type recombinase/integrase [FCB group bacterium]|nr:tyrosine-type recombinase/integrase [FCB group bacterium]
MAFAKLYHLKNSKKQIVYYVRYYLPGQCSKDEKRFTIGSVSNRRAKEICERIRAMVIQSVDPNEYFETKVNESNEIQRLKLSQLQEAYLKHCALSNQPSTIELKEDAYENLRSFLGNCYVDKVTPEKIEDWMSSLKISKTTINIKLRTVRAMFNWGVKRGLITDNPFVNSGIQQFRVPDTDPEDYFTVTEIEKILHTLKANDEQLWRLVFLALETGGRLAEILALTGKDIDLEKQRVLFRGPTTKTGQRRYVPLREQAVKMIEKWNIAADEKLFGWKYANSASRKFRYLLEDLNIRKTSSGTRSFHTLRHTYASHLLMSGVNIFIVSRWMGHSSVRVTEKHYGHLIPETVAVELPWEY